MSNLMIQIDGKWLLSEIEDLLRSIKDLYLIFFAIDEMKQEYIEFKEKFDKLSPHYIEDFFLLFPERFQKWPFQFPFYNDLQSERIMKAIINRTWYIPLENQILLESFKFSSPGDFVISAGPVLEQIRELIKDLSYRNRQEQQLGEIKLLNEYVKLLKNMGHTSNQIQIIIQDIRKPIDVLDKNIKLKRIDTVA